ncbi:helix-turn-helix domain-containing protein [Methylobacterium tarhaniae]|uniref:helix-turn-helix domain-containing protein n=1 Tax=Methylobacterium tarhaniae TaxID=1187852 RepID=UPI00069F2450|nr:helix-turn-helix domain-containing protein [Methylobacterium tarhaniae]
MERSSLAGTPVVYGQPAVGRAAGWVVLPMTQPDIADTLLTIETASRAVTRLEREGALARAGARRVGPCRPALRRVPCA